MAKDKVCLLLGLVIRELQAASATVTGAPAEFIFNGKLGPMNGYSVSEKSGHKCLRWASKISGHF